jgi:indolepyruvate ferredoxin oxidoreductase beta subunit
MKKDIIISGVGGQGILSIAAVIDLAALSLNYHVKQSEIHGMSQRGGSVQSHLRISDEIIYSDLIESGTADLIISVEPLEALRYFNYLSPTGSIVSSTNAFLNINHYPDEKLILEELNKIKKVVLLDAEKIARECGNIKASNMVILGAAFPFLNLDKEVMEQSIRRFFDTKGAETVNLNIKAFEEGLRANNFSNN